MQSTPQQQSRRLAQAAMHPGVTVHTAPPWFAERLYVLWPINVSAYFPIFNRDKLLARCDSKPRF